MIYTHRQYLYYQEDYHNAREYFICVSDYSDARKYLKLIEVRWTQDVLVNAKNIAQDLINNFYFEDTNVVVLENDSVAGKFLKGEWTTEDGYYGFEIKNDGSAFNSLPQVQDHSYYYIYQGEWIGYNTSKFVPLTISQLTMIMNIALLVVSFLLVGKDFGIKTVYTSLLLPVVIGVF